MKREKGALLGSTAMKILAAVLVLVFAAITAGGVAGVAFMIDEGVYFQTEEEMREWQFQQEAERTAESAMYTYLFSPEEQDWEQQFAHTNVIGLKVQATDGTALAWGDTTMVTPYRAVFRYEETPDGGIQSWLQGSSTPHPELPAEEMATCAEVELYVSPTLTERDGFYWLDLLITAAYALRYWVFVLIALALAGAIWCFVFLIRSAGHRAGSQEIHPWPTVKVPADLWYAATGLGLFLLIEFVAEGFFYRPMGLWFLILGGLVIFYCVLFLCMEFAVRCKAGGFWRHTVLYWLVVRVLRLLRKIGGFCKELVLQLPLLWKTALIYVTISGLTLLLVCFNYGELDNLIVLWCVENLLLFPAVLAAALMMRKLLAAGKKLAEGDMTHQVDTSKLVLDFKTHGDHLNHIGEGMAVAVDQRLKSERMKTALITNVPHDIKTPLTSIINYSELICNESCDNETITQYAEVLHRQSEKLKRLIEDLVEASKASTGNMEINLAPCDVGVVLTQAVGEYEEKLSEKNLELITRKPEPPVTILADGRRLWRIFDNLMVNISKYAQPSTRVYLTLEEDANTARISFKNISAAVLDISPDELLERFVRGDASRTSEGNGLGLSITKSLTELQGGTMEISIDGDLFKVVLSFPKQGRADQA